MIPLPLPREVSAGLLDWAIEVVIASGRRVEVGEPAGPWETPKQFRVRVVPHLDDDTFLKRLHHVDCPPMPVKVSRRGKLLKLRATASLEAWVKRPVDDEKRRAQ